MFKRLLDTHLKLANGKSILILLLLFLLTNLIIIPAIYPKFQTLDTLSSYTAEKARELISSYGEQGRQYYAGIEVSLDLLYPFVTAFMFALLILYTFQRAFLGKKWALYLALTSYVESFLKNTICLDAGEYDIGK